MNSYWIERTNIKEYPKLENDIEADVCIVGAGIVGVTLAYLLNKQGKKVVLLEKDRVLSNTTANTTAKITSQHGFCYSKILKSNGFESAKEYVRKVTLPDSIVKIDFYAFYECTSLEQINLPKDLCHIGSYAFASCTSLKHISIPANAINQYSHGAFGSSGLETVELADGIQMLTSSLFAATRLTHVEIPASVKVIEYNVFGSCTELASVTLHEGLERMDAEVFKQTKITEIEIPASVCELDAYTFGWCDQLRAVRFHGNAPDGEYVRQDDDWGITLGSYTVYYHADARGFTSPEWYGYPTEIW